jgi:tetratricopeptide (TPR) repeat protein
VIFCSLIEEKSPEFHKIMPLPHPRIAAVLLTMLLGTGCRFPGRDGPVPQSLVDCRRLSQQGVAAMDRGQQQTAETLLAKAVAACPVDAEARRQYAEALWRRGARPEAMTQLQEAVRLTGEDATLWSRLAEMNLACGQLENARQNAERAIDLNPKLPGAWTVRAGVLQADGRLQQALDDYIRALGYSPKDREILMAVAEIYRQMNQPDRSLQTLQTLADTYSPGEEPGQLLFRMGNAYVALGRYDDGVESLSAAVTREKNPTPDMYCALGEAEFLAGHADEAVAAARQALVLQPQHSLSRNLLNRIELAQRPGETPR